VFKGDAFALKGGTAINMFVRDMPRLSIDIDLAYTPRGLARGDALSAIASELASIRDRLTRAGLDVRAIGAADTGDRAILVTSGRSVVKVEANIVFRGTVLPVQRRSLVPGAAERFSVELALPVLAVEELYGSKLVAAMDRQHPRDLFDVSQMLASDGLTDGVVECFVTYLAGHGRPMHEVLFASAKDIALEFHSTFVGMTAEPITLAVLMQARSRIFEELPARLTAAHRQFLVGLARARPEWSLLRCPHAAELPALQWKLQNLKKLQKEKPTKFDEQARALEQKIGQEA
jgi:hypothetical protein